MKLTDDTDDLPRFRAASDYSGEVCAWCFFGMLLVMLVAVWVTR